MVKRTTILADESLLIEAQQYAEQRGMSFTRLVDVALREYLDAHRPRRRLEFVGMGHSGEPGVSVADGWDEAILAGATDMVAGWAREPLDAKDNRARS